MSADLQKMPEGKRALRRDLAHRPIAEKLAVLERLRERRLALRAGRSTRVSVPPNESTSRSS